MNLSDATHALLIGRFYKDASAVVRAKIVSGFGTENSSDSVPVQQLLRDAFQDQDHRVRHAASIGALKLGDEGVRLLVNQLNDQNRVVRLQAASVLNKTASMASDHVAEIEAAIGREQDAEIQQRLRSALSAIKHKD